MTTRTRTRPADAAGISDAGRRRVWAVPVSALYEGETAVPVDLAPEGLDFAVPAGGVDVDAGMVPAVARALARRAMRTVVGHAGASYVDTVGVDSRYRGPGERRPAPLPRPLRGEPFSPAAFLVDFTLPPAERGLVTLWVTDRDDPRVPATFEGVAVADEAGRPWRLAHGSRPAAGRRQARLAEDGIRFVVDAARGMDVDLALVGAWASVLFEAGLWTFYGLLGEPFDDPRPPGRTSAVSWVEV